MPENASSRRLINPFALVESNFAPPRCAEKRRKWLLSSNSELLSALIEVPADDFVRELAISHEVPDKAIGAIPPPKWRSKRKAAVTQPLARPGSQRRRRSSD